MATFLGSERFPPKDNHTEKSLHFTLSITYIIKICNTLRDGPFIQSQVEEVEWSWKKYLTIALEIVF